MPTGRAERIAQNESAFRALNESLEASVHRGRPPSEFVGFVCECGLPDCQEIVRIALPSYESIRQDSQLFFVRPGHELSDVEDVVRTAEGYNVVRKHADVAEIVDKSHTRNDRGS